MEQLKEIFNKSLEFGEDTSLTLGRVLLFLVVLIISWLVTRIIARILYNTLKRREVDTGKTFAITRIVKYILYVLFFIIALQVLHLNLGGLVLGASALLVGVGIGLQQIFYDLFAGLFLLFERKVQVGDYVDIDEMNGRVEKIDMRTSVVRTRDNISVIVPNSKLISENVINWSHHSGVMRFEITVGVAYGSNVQKVKKVLIECALSHDAVLQRPEPSVQFREFGESSLNFRLLFWSRNIKAIERIRSDLHFAIDKSFRENRITIAFPQVDVHLYRTLG